MYVYCKWHQGASNAYTVGVVYVPGAGWKQKLVVLTVFMPKIQNIHDTITILSAACKHQPSCSPDATHDTHHFFPGIGSSCWKVAVIFLGGDAFPMNHLEKFAFTTLHQFWTTLSRMWFGHQYLWAQNLFSDLQMRGMDVCPSLLFGGGM